MSRPWKEKFGDAFRGLCEVVRRESSFAVHLAVAAAVIAAAAILRMGAVEWSVLLLCIAGVLAAETFNTALESMARAIAAGENRHLRDALDVGSGAVLTAAFGAVAVGAVALRPPRRNCWAGGRRRLISSRDGGRPRRGCAP